MSPVEWGDEMLLHSRYCQLVTRFQDVTPLEECLCVMCSSLGNILLFNLSGSIVSVEFAFLILILTHFSFLVALQTPPHLAGPRSMPAAFASIICTEAPSMDLMTTDLSFGPLSMQSQEAGFFLMR